MPTPDNVQTYDPTMAFAALVLIAIMGVALIIITLVSKLNKVPKIIICIVSVILTAVTIFLTNTVIQQLLVLK